jgi:hypothetical protein
MTNSVFGGDASIQPSDYRASLHARYFRPLVCGKRFAKRSYEPNCRPVAVLNVASRPSTVFFRVALVIVNSVKRMPLAWAWSHVLKKVLKRSPLITVRNPPASIMRKPFIGLIVASIFHVCPGSIFGLYAPNSTHPMRRVSVGNALIPVASTASSCSTALHQRNSKHRSSATAIAPANPPGRLSLNFIKANHLKLPESHPGHINPNHTILLFYTNIDTPESIQTLG